MNEPAVRLSRTVETKPCALHPTAENELFELLRILTHDLQAPARRARQLCEMLIDDIDDQIEGKTRNLLRAIVRSSSKMEEMVGSASIYQEILLMPFDFKVFNLDEKVKCIKKALLDQHQHISPRIELDALPEIIGDKRQLTYVFEQLIDNALKFGAVDYSPVISVEYYPTEDGHRFRIVDNGPGIPVDSHAWVFRIFGQLNPNHSNGLGMGLAASRVIVAKHGGTMWIDDTDNGTAIVFTLPAVPPGTDEASLRGA